MVTLGDLESHDPAMPTAPTEGMDAAPPDDASVFRNSVNDTGIDPSARKEALLQQCEERVDRAWLASGPRKIAAEIESHSCTALKGGRTCVKCRMCPSEGMWATVSGYYKGQKGKVFICAEKAPSQEQVESTLTHELLNAYDHCRLGMRVPFVGIQAPWALSCAASACSEVRGYLLSSLQRHAPGSLGSFGGGFSSGGGFGGGTGGFGNSGGFGGGGGFAGGSYGDSGMSDGTLPEEPASEGADGGGGGMYSAAPSRSAASDMDRLREAVYAASFASVSGFGLCEQEGRDPRATLDAVFNACMADQTPLGPSAPNPTGAAFPPMPPEVGAAEKAPQIPAAPVPPLPNQGGEQTKPKWGEA